MKRGRPSGRESWAGCVPGRRSAPLLRWTPTVRPDLHGQRRVCRQMRKPAAFRRGVAAYGNARLFVHPSGSGWWTRRRQRRGQRGGFAQGRTGREGDGKRWVCWRASRPPSCPTARSPCAGGCATTASVRLPCRWRCASVVDQNAGPGEHRVRTCTTTSTFTPGWQRRPRADPNKPVLRSGRLELSGVGGRLLRRRQRPQHPGHHRHGRPAEIRPLGRADAALPAGEPAHHRHARLPRQRASMRSRSSRMAGATTGRRAVVLRAAL